MPSSTYLPDLVVIRILQFAECYDSDHLVDNFKNKLEFLHVCRDWRQTALPLVYRQIFIADSNNFTIASNIDLYTTNKKCKYAKHLDIRLTSTVGKPFLNQFASVLNILNRDDFGWPLNIENRLVGFEVNSGTPSEQNILLALDDDLLEIMHGVVESFCQDFSSIHSLCIIILEPHGVVSQLADELIEAIGTNLRSLKLFIKPPLNLIKFPDSLENLNYEMSVWSFPPIPQINPTTITKLALSNIPNDFLWQQTFASAVNQKTVELTRLKTLDLKYPPNSVDVNRKWLSILLDKQYVTNNYIDDLVDLPSLKYLSIYKLDEFKEMPFTINNISLQLKGVSLKLYPQAFYEFCNLNIKHVDNLDVELEGSEARPLWFFKATERLLASDTRISQATINLENLYMDIDPKLIKWPGLKELFITKLTGLDLITLLLQNSNLELIVANMFEYPTEQDYSLKVPIGLSSKLHTLDISRCTLDRKNIDLCVQFTFDLVKTLTCLKKLYIHKYIEANFKSKLAESDKYCSHLKWMDIITVKHALRYI